MNWRFAAVLSNTLRFGLGFGICGYDLIGSMTWGYAYGMVPG